MLLFCSSYLAAFQQLPMSPLQHSCSHFLSLLQRNENSVRAIFPLCSLQALIAAKAALRERNLFRTVIVALVLRFIQNISKNHFRNLCQSIYNQLSNEGTAYRRSPVPPQGTIDLCSDVGNNSIS